MVQSREERLLAAVERYEQQPPTPPPTANPSANRFGSVRTVIILLVVGMAAFVGSIPLGIWSDIFVSGNDILSTSQRLLGLVIYLAWQALCFLSFGAFLLGLLSIVLCFVQPKIEWLGGCAMVLVMYVGYLFAFPRWEYAIASPSDKAFERVIDRMGSQGWELVSSRRASSPGNGNEMNYEMIFKRKRFP